MGDGLNPALVRGRAREEASERGWQCLRVVCACVDVHVQSPQTLRDPMGCSLPASSACGILQARTLEQFAISCSRGLPRLGDRTRFCVFCFGRQVLYCRANQEARVQHSNSCFHVLNFTGKNLRKSVFSLIIRVPTYCSQFYPLAYKPKVFTVWPVQEMLADPCSHLTGLARIGREKGPHSEKSENQHAQGVWGAGHGVLGTRAA